MDRLTWWLLVVMVELMCEVMCDVCGGGGVGGFCVLCDVC